MTWWCSATGVPWTGEWAGYPGVWLFLGLLIAGYWRAGRAAGQPGAAAVRFGIGVGLLWVALDWPLGALGGYLASAHTGQFLLIALAAPPFLLLGLGPRLGQVDPGGRAGRILRSLAHPAPAFVGYNLILVVTHLPAVVDGLMPSQLGSLAIDLAWLFSGVLLWWPVTAPVRFQRISAPLQMGYLFIQTIPATLPAAFLIFADYPLYRLYELAPRVAAEFGPRYDHQVAGLMMKIVGDPIVWIGIMVIFFRWANSERRADLSSTRLDSGPSA